MVRGTIDSQRLPQVPPLNADRLKRLAEYVSWFHGIGLRADQCRRLELYLRGLLDGAEPKNSEAIARRWASYTEVSRVAQGIQHFLSSSPWDVARFLACYRSRLGQVHRDRLRLWVVQDVVFPKRGHHSVGTRRQLARPIGRKINCQVAVAISELRDGGFFPLAIRLYLPGHWLREHHDRANSLVPSQYREYRSKVDTAIELIDELGREGLTNDFLTADSGFLSTQGFIEAVSLRKMALLRPVDEVSTTLLDIWSQAELMAVRREDWEIASEAEKEVKRAALASLSLSETEKGFDWLRTQLGLDQYEGRNWLGWHHHVALVFAAYGFLLTERL